MGEGSGGEFGRKVGRGVLVEGVGVTTREGAPEGLHRATHPVDEHRAGGDQVGAVADGGEVSLLLGRAMDDGREEDRVATAQAGEDLGVGAVALVVAVSDQVNLARVGDDDGELFLAEEAGEPGRMHPHFKDNAG